ncbi:MAG: hypothetical protein ACT4PY_09295 [Armatimonadota bacterium]
MPNTLVTLEAKPAPISVDVTKTAVIVVDMQISRWGFVPISRT